MHDPWKKSIASFIDIEAIHLKFELFAHVGKINKKCEILIPFDNFSHQIERSGGHSWALGAAGGGWGVLEGRVVWVAAPRPTNDHLTSQFGVKNYQKVLKFRTFC